jgi:excisionase family DNA binding protein
MSHELLPITLPDASRIGPYFTTDEVARLLRVTQRAVQKWVRTGRLPARRYGRVLRIREADLVAFGEEQAGGTPVSS